MIAHTELKSELKGELTESFVRNDAYTINNKHTQGKTENTMITQIKRPVYTFIGISLFSIFLSGCIVHVNAKDADWDYEKGSESSYSGDISSTNKSVKVGEGRSVENISSVNGSVKVSDDVSAEDISSVNGKVSIGDNVSADSVESVNGQVKIGSGFKSRGQVSTVNGGIRIDNDSSVGGAVSTVNGSIRLEGVIVGKDISTKNGSVTLKDGSVVKGDIHFEPISKNNYNKRRPTLYISADSVVEGNIILDRPVDLELENPDLADKVKRNYE